MGTRAKLFLRDFCSFMHAYTHTVCVYVYVCAHMYTLHGMRAGVPLSIDART